jgi:hypothetical protein
MSRGEARHWDLRCEIGRLATDALILAGIVATISGAAILLAQAGGDTVITIDFVETHDRLPPDEWLGIVRKHEIVATLTTDNRVSERNESYSTQGMRPLPMQAENNEAIGDSSAKVVWRVLGPHKLQRIFAGRQFLMMVDVEITPANSCNAQVKYLLQKGYSDMITRRADNGGMAHFSLPKLIEVGCSIR